jgi:hypothetical protein
MCMAVRFPVSLLTRDPELAAALPRLLLARGTVLRQAVEPTFHLRCAFTRILNLLLTWLIRDRYLLRYLRHLCPSLFQGEVSLRATIAWRL